MTLKKVRVRLKLHNLICIYCTYVCVWVQTYSVFLQYICACMHPYICTYVCVHMYMCMYVCTCIHIHTYIQ